MGYMAWWAVTIVGTNDNLESIKHWLLKQCVKMCEPRSIVAGLKTKD